MVTNHKAICSDHWSNKMQKASVAEIYGNKGRFIATLAAAELNARSSWECEFTNNIRDRFERSGESTTITPMQRRQLGKLAAGN